MEQEGGMSNRVKIRKKVRPPMCRRCNSEYGGKHYLAYKEGFGWVCRECGYHREVKEWKMAMI